MKQFLKTLLLITIVAVSTGVISYQLGRRTAVADALARKDALAWLQTDFHLTDRQFAKVKALHESYAKVCEEHCRAIQDAAQVRTAIASASPSNPTALAAAERRLQDLRQVCETAIAAHVRQVSAEMSPAEGQRYLALVLPKIADFDHRAAPDLQLSSHRH